MRAKTLAIDLGVDHAQLCTLIWKNEKGRFEAGRLRSEATGRWHVDNEITHVRACQGHTIPWIVTGRLQSQVLPGHLVRVATICHGTRKDRLQSILRWGLLRGGGQIVGGADRDVHLSPFASYDERAYAGMRFQSEAIVHMHVPGVLGHGVYIASNGCILSPRPYPRN